MRGCRTGLVSALAGVVLAVSACQTSAPFAAEAEEWMATHDAAFDLYNGAHSQFFAPGIVQDSGMVRAELIGHGPREAEQIQSLVYRTAFDRGTMYLDATGLVRTDSWVWPEDADRSPELRTYAVLAWMQIGADGIEHFQHQVYGYDYNASEALRSAQAAAEQIAADYVDARNGHVPARVASLYAPDATVTDSVLGMRAEGMPEISALAEARTSGRVELDRVDQVYPEQVLPLGPNAPPAGDAPMVHVYLTPDRDGALEQAWLHLHTTDSCTDASVVRLTLNAQQQITAERRFHSLESLRGCADPDSLVDGWWAEDLPGPFAERVTGDLDTAAGVVEVRNSGADYDQLIVWAFDRFDEAGLPQPTVGSITLDPFDPRCDEAPGYASWASTTTDILVCLDGGDVPWATDRGSDDCAEPDCFDQAPTPARHLLLHEIAHAWLVEHLDQQTRESFIRVVDAESWNDPDIAWANRGIEWAAETLAWGLNDQPPVALATIGSPRCPLLAAGYQSLTGTPAPHICTT